LLRFGIPDFKLSKTVIDRRLDLMIREGLEVRTGITIGKDIPFGGIVVQYDAICLAIGSGRPRDLNVAGREFKGICFAMDFLSAQNRVNAGLLTETDREKSAEGKRVLVIGGGDTGSDCVGTSIRQRAASVTQIEILPKPPVERTPDNPWPYFGKILKTSTSHEEGCERLWGVSTLRFVGDGSITRGAEIEEVKWESVNGRYTMSAVPGTRRVIEADLILLALGFLHPVTGGLTYGSGIELDDRQNIKVNNNQITNIPGVFAAGDSVSGASLVVDAIASGRKSAIEIDKFLRKND